MKMPKLRAALFLWLILSLLIAPVAMVGCSDDDDDKKSSQVDDDTKDDTKTSTIEVTVGGTSTSESVEFTADGAWTAEITTGADWLNADKLSGEAGKVTLQLSFSANDSDLSRMATIVVTTSTQSITITVSQEQLYADGAREDVMLQGFYWDSQKVTGWQKLTTQYADDIAKSFTCVWLPPSASAEGGNTVGGNNVGYHPRQWNDQNSCWGTAADLKTLISTLHNVGVKVIADVVINHRSGDTGWGNFTTDDFGDYGTFQLDASHICSNDEMNDPSQCSDPNWLGTAKGNPDSGENWGGARDLDHMSDYVQQDCIAYLSWLKGEFGYDGWRYDFCKGFAGKYVGKYNDASDPYLSVGELWDGSYDVVNAWIQATGYKSMAFDFPSKYDALNNGLAKGNYSSMSWLNLDDNVRRPAGLIHHSKTDVYAVTFVDNHDTYRDDSKYTGDVASAYAFILSAPGVPCVFWPHWQDKNYKTAIENMIAARKSVGLTNKSSVTVTAVATYYEARAIGRRGELICRIGANAPTSVPDGFEEACSGSGWVFYVKK